MKNNLAILIKAAKALEDGFIDETLFKKAVMDYICDDEQIIPNMLLVLSSEREKRKELLSDFNVNLSRALVSMSDFNTNGKVDKQRCSFVVDEIKKNYIKWREYISCNFLVKGLD